AIVYRPRRVRVQAAVPKHRINRDAARTRWRLSPGPGQGLRRTATISGRAGLETGFACWSASGLVDEVQFAAIVEDDLGAGISRSVISHELAIFGGAHNNPDLVACL